MKCLRGFKAGMGHNCSGLGSLFMYLIRADGTGPSPKVWAYIGSAGTTYSLGPLHWLLPVFTGLGKPRNLVYILIKGLLEHAQVQARKPGLV